MQKDKTKNKKEVLTKETFLKALKKASKKSSKKFLREKENLVRSKME